MLWQPTRGILQPNQHWRRAQTPPAAGGGTTWNPADKTGNSILSNGNLTSTSNSSAGPAQARSVASCAYLGGKRYCECTLTMHASANGENVSIGVASASHSYTNYLGQGGTAIGFWPMTHINGCGAYINGTKSNWGNMGGDTGDVYAMANDFTTDPPRHWWKNLTKAGNWNGNLNGDPVAGTNAYAPAAFGGSPWFIAIEMDVISDAITLNDSGSYVGSLPSGYSAWA